MSGPFLRRNKSAATKAAPIFHKATMSFIEKSTAFPDTVTVSPTHSQYRIPVRADDWKAVMRDLFSRLHQYGAIMQWVEPVTGSSFIPYLGTNTLCTSCDTNHSISVASEGYVFFTALS